MQKSKEKEKSNHPLSAYDEFLHSVELDALDDELEHFATKPKSHTERADYPPTRVAAARKTERESIPVRRSGAALTDRDLSKEYAGLKANEGAASTTPAKRKAAKKTYKNDAVITLIAAFIITALIFIFGVATLAGKIDQYSENENRYLAGRPQLSAASLADGKYMEDMESYLSDQFAGRSTLVKARTAIDILCGKKEINGVYIGSKHFLFEKPAAYEEAVTGKSIDSINTFTKKHKKLNSYLAIAPDSTAILAEYMPRNAPNTDQQQQIKDIYAKLDKSIKTIDIYSTLAGNDEKQSLYYRTDHHWTTKAAEIAFKQIAANMKIDTSKVVDKSYAVTNDFQGTLAASSGLFNAKDTIYISAPETDVKYVVSYINENKKSSSLFDSSKLEKKNQYEVFLGGNFSQVKIDTTLNSKKVLMVVKDSYANCMLPLLVPYYKSIVVIDPRYYTDKIEQTIKKEGVTDILWLYNANTFLTDTSIDSVF